MTGREKDRSQSMELMTKVTEGAVADHIQAPKRKFVRRAVESNVIHDVRDLEVNIVHIYM